MIFNELLLVKYEKKLINVKLGVCREHVVGWPPVRASRKNIGMKNSICKYVKVAVDGAPYLRKVDLEVYESYNNLITSLNTMFATNCFTICTYSFIINNDILCCVHVIFMFHLCCILPICCVLWE